MNLYDINKEQAELLDKLEMFTDEDGVVDNLFFEIQEELENKLTDKVDNIGKLIRSLEANQKALQDEAQNLSDKAKKIDNKIESIKKYAEFIMKKFGLEKMDGILFNFQYSKSKQTEIIDQMKLPRELRHYSSTIKDLTDDQIGKLTDLGLEVSETLSVNKTEAKKWFENLPAEEQEKYKDIILIKEVKTLKLK